MACADCADSCSGSCNDTCEGTCYGSCDGCGGGCSHCSNCTNGCQGGCGTTCKGTCTSCSGCGSCGSGCTSCTGSCKGDCNNGCQTDAKNELIANFPLDDIIKASDLNNIIEQIQVELNRRSKSGIISAKVARGEKALEVLRNNIYQNFTIINSDFSTELNSKLDKNEMQDYITELTTLANTNLKA